MKFLIIFVVYILPLTLSARESSIVERPIITGGNLSFVVVEESPKAFLVEIVTEDRDHLVQFIRSSVIAKPSGWERGDNPFLDVNGDGKRNIKDVFPRLNIDNASGTYQQGASPSKDPVWRGNYTVIEYVATA